MGVHRESTTGLDNIIIHNHEGMKTTMVWVIVVGERESEACMKPSVFRDASFIGRSEFKFHQIKNTDSNSNYKDSFGECLFILK